MAPVDRIWVTLAGRSTLEPALGAGGMATVYLADDSFWMNVAR